MNNIIYSLTLCCLFLFGCDNSKPGDYNSTHNYLPPDAIIITIYDDIWAKWELNGECFLSCNLGTHYSVLTKVDCNK